MGMNGTPWLLMLSNGSQNVDSGRWWWTPVDSAEWREREGEKRPEWRPIFGNFSV
jgi:hypothetical protein